MKRPSFEVVLIDFLHFSSTEFIGIPDELIKSWLHLLCEYSSVLTVIK